jgi:hypothetical protein
MDIVGVCEKGENKTCVHGHVKKEKWFWHVAKERKIISVWPNKGKGLTCGEIRGKEIKLSA